MQTRQKFARVDTQELKSRITKKLGHQRAQHYFNSLRKFLSFKLNKDDFDKICFGVLGKENIKLHNFLIRSILGNASLSLGPPSKQTVTGNSQTSMVSNGPLGNGALPANKGWSITSRDRKFADRPSPLGPHGKAPHGHGGEVSNSCDVPRSREQLSTLEFVSSGSKVMLEVVSVEDGEEVEQVRSSPACVQSRSPIRAPLGITKAHTPQPSTSYTYGTCFANEELPDTRSLWQALQHRLQAQGLNVSMEGAHVLNSGLNSHLTRLLKSSLDVAKARGKGTRIPQANGRAGPSWNGGQNHGFPSESGQSYQASLQDVKVAVESNRQLLGCDYSKQREKISFRLMEQ
ncbi:hypothetical protein D1007_51775 [Hordeum vulgare]|uniref:Predicted protein n=1 Tax=Hordeum vulgare subsp. vulgare TaxID=112509 RepID=F2E9E8_HORVV|nr:uncharacterized protein LOC123447775 [Hordeum vulgare subsp. vulgare]KAE8775706.1 hypothetical protein D1007_51775 [Hordeum vulgare]BAK03970.1 predicted protein [Hordeum vulgare subsp. vulgare]